MNAIVVDASEEEPLPVYRKRIKALVKRSPRLGWGYDPFTNFGDLVPSIKIARGKESGTVIEIVAHGSPLYHHDIGSKYLAPFAVTLRKIIPTGGQTTVYLTGCNTGLFEAGYCIAEELARALGDVTVCGAAGFVISGAAITEDAVTAAEHEGETYPGSRDDSHPGCWKCFKFPQVLAIAVQGADASPLLKPTPDIGHSILREAIAEAMHSPRPRRLAPFLIGPDVRGIVELEDGALAFEILQHGAVLRNALSRETFDFPRGPELLEQFLRGSP